jgi:hypothetical protein
MPSTIPLRFRISRPCYGSRRPIQGLFYFQGGHLLSEIKAIETRYNGYRFRSRLEAKWAIFFDQCAIKYEYEPDGVILPDGTGYLPDFYLPDFKTYVEVKRDGGDASKAVSFGLSIHPDHEHKGIAIIFGLPSYRWFAVIDSSCIDMCDDVDMPYMDENYFYPIERDGEFFIGIKHIANGFPWWEGRLSLRWRFQTIAYLDPSIAGSFLDSIEVLDKAIKVANEARFEFGETPKGPRD